MSSSYLKQLSSSDREALIEQLHSVQNGKCFICEQPVDLVVHKDAIDIDHVEPSKVGGTDGPSNFAITHASCNRSKQASDLRVARVLARFDRIRKAAEEHQRGPNLSDVLAEYGGATQPLAFDMQPDEVRYSFAEIGDPAIRSVPVHQDPLSGLRYFFERMPIAYLHHDDRINPRGIGNSLGRLVEEFHRGRPQLHVALGWMETGSGSCQIKVFDGQHKAAAQVLLGVPTLPVRVFIDPDLDLLLTANTNAGTTLRQVAFDKSVQRRLGSSLFAERLTRYRKDRGLPEDDESFSERDLVSHFKAESREVRRYAVDAVRTAIVHDEGNRLTPYIELGGKGTERPLSYSTVEKTFLSFFVYSDVLDSALNFRADEGLNPRDLEVSQVVELMNIVADEIYIGKFNPDIGAARIEHKVAKGEDIPEPHLRAFRMGKEEVMGAWLSYVRQIVQGYFSMTGMPVQPDRLFQYQFPVQMWDNLRNYVRNLSKLPVWVNREIGPTIFAGKQLRDYWQQIFETGKTPHGQQVLASPINLMDMIKEPPAS